MNYRTGQWIVLPSESRIKNTESHQMLRLSPREMELLIFFLERPNTTISLQMLIDEVWSGRIVSDHAIYRVINKVRKHLDPNNKDAFIETLPKRGYRFIQTVNVEQVDKAILHRVTELNKQSTTVTSDQKESEDKPEISVARSEENKPGQQLVAKKKNLPILFTVFVGMALIYILWSQWYKPKVYTQEVDVYRSFQPFEARTGFKAYPDISENGRFVVYSYKANADDRYRLQIRDLALHNTLSVNFDNGDDELAAYDDTYPVVSANGKSIIFIRTSLDDCKVIYLSEFQGSYIAQDLLNCLGNRDMDIALDPEGTHLYYSYRDSRNKLKRIFSLVINTGEKKQLSGLSDEVGNDESLVYVAADKRLYFIRDRGNEKIVYSYLIDEKRLDEVFRTDDNIANIDFRKSVDALTFSKNAKDIVQYSLAHGSINEIASSLSESISSYDINPINDELLLGLVSSSNSFYSRRIMSSSGREFSKLVLLESEFNDRQPTKLKEDKLVFISDRSGVNEVWSLHENGTVELLSDLEGQSLGDWLQVAPDGINILAFTDKGILEINSYTKEQKLLVSSDTYPDSVYPTYSFDGDYIYFSSTLSSAIQLYRLDRTTGQIEQFSDTGIYVYFDRGLEQFALKAHRNGLWQLKNDSELMVIPKLSKQSVNAMAFSQWGLYYIKQAERELVFHPYSLLYDHDSRIDTGIYVDNEYLSLGADENRLLFYQRTDLSSNIIASQ